MKPLQYLLLALVSSAQLVAATATLETVRKKGSPAVLASSCEVMTDAVGNSKITFFGVTPERSSAPYAAGAIVVFSDDPRLRRHIEYHFADLKKTEKRTASTMFGSSEAHGTQVEVFEIVSRDEVRSVFSGRIRVAFLESKERPNKAPEPTTGSVTPRATEGVSK